MKIWLARWVCLDVENNLQRAREEVRRAVSGGAELVVFPELFLTGYKRSLDPAVARALFAEVSGSAPEALLIFGSISEARRNRVTAWCGGRELAAYDKVHLFRPNGEHELWDPGESYVAFGWRGRRIGLLNCNDLRFPEQARALKLEARCDVLVAVAPRPHLQRATAGAGGGEPALGPGLRDRGLGVARGGLRRRRQPRLRPGGRAGAHRRRPHLRARFREPAAVGRGSDRTVHRDHEGGDRR
jgi:hypothetical protein